MNKIYSRINWENYPSEATPLNERNLNKIDLAVDNLDDRIINLDSQKVSTDTILSGVKTWTMDEDTGIITIVKYDGSQIIFDLNIEKIPVDFELSKDGILTMTTADGKKFTANIGAMIPILTFTDSDTISVSVSGEGINKSYSFSVKNGSITADKLQPNYLTDITVQAEKAIKSANDAQTSAENASQSEINSKQSEDNSKQSEINAKQSEDNTLQYREDSLIYKQDAQVSAENASQSEINSKQSELNAKQSEDNITQIEVNVIQAENNVIDLENKSKLSALKSEGYAIGTQDGEVVSSDSEYYNNNAKYYAEQAQAVTNIGNGNITIKQEGEIKGSFTVNQNNDTEINLSYKSEIDDTKTSTDTTWSSQKIQEKLGDSITVDGTTIKKDESGVISVSSDITDKLDGIEEGANKTIIHNGLDSDSTTEALSAAKGKELNDKIGNFSNPNLLDNPDFRINQRGQSQYSVDGYTIDRWRQVWEIGTVNVMDNGININNSITAQSLEKLLADNLLGKTVTLSMSVNGVIKSTTETLPNNYPDNQTTFCTVRIDNVECYGVLSDWIGKDQITIRMYSNNNNNDIINWIKLELGSIATPFIPPNPSTELLKCQRYYQRIDNKFSSFPSVGIGYIDSLGNGIVDYIMPVPMRILPTINCVGTQRADIITTQGDLNRKVTNIKISNSSTPNKIAIDFKLLDVENPSNYKGSICKLYASYWVENNDYIEFSADL